MNGGVFPLVIAVLPLAMYFLMLGGLRVYRPLVTTGARDGAALAIAVSGLVMVGPIYLFFPSEAAAALGWIVWIVLMVFYMLCVTLILLSMKPKILIYGMRSSDVIDPLFEACRVIDPTATLDSGREQIVLNGSGVHLRIESLGFADSVQIESFEKNLHPRFWHHLLLELRKRTATAPVAKRMGGVMMIAFGLAMTSLVIVQVARQPEALMAGFRQWLQL
jgi:uncharacterized membrane protein